jgi:hypothetical protein
MWSTLSLGLVEELVLMPQEEVELVACWKGLQTFLQALP